jgi:hypothetical protein
MKEETKPVSLKPIRIVVLAAWMPLGNSGDIDMNVSGWLSNVKFVNNLISLLPDKVNNSVPFPVKVMSVTQTFSNKVVVIQLDSFKTNVFKDSSPKEDKIFVPFFKVLILSISLTSEVYVSIIVSLGTGVREGNLSPPSFDFVYWDTCCFVDKTDLTGFVNKSSLKS